MAIKAFSWLNKHSSQIHKIAKKNEPHYIILPGTIIKVWICYICEIISIQDKGCQLLSKFIDNIYYIIISLTPYSLSMFKCWQLSAIRRTVSPLIPVEKETFL